LVTGISAPSSTTAIRPGETTPAAGATSARLTLLRFPDDDAAKGAARELEDADFAVAGENQKVTSSKYDAAQLHWRPNVPSMGGFLAKGQFVMSVIINRPTADHDDLLAWVEKVYTAWQPRVEKFTPVPASQLDKTPLDGDGMLARVLRDGDTPPDPDIKSVGLVDPNAAAFTGTDVGKWGGVIAENGIDKFARRGTNWLFRARDAEAAKRAQTAIERGLPEWTTRADSPKQLTTAVCKKLEAKSVPSNNTYRCYLTYGRYIATLVTNDPKDAQQKTAAQYALLANSG
jgi:hypothetical protein